MTAFGLLGESEVNDITGDRHGTTDWRDSPSFRRWAVKRDYDDPQMLDEEDSLEILVDLEMGYAQNAAMAMGRKMDKVIVDAATATAVTGATGTGTSAFDTGAPAADGTGNQIAVGGTGLTLDKMRQARGWFDTREVGVDEMNMGMSNFVWVTNGIGHRQLMEQTETTSSDYIGIEIVQGKEIAKRMPLVSGRIPFMMGFRILIVNQLNTTSSNHINLAWHHKAMGLGVWGGRRVWIGDLPEHRLSRGIYVKEHFGAVRVHDRGILAVVCQP